MIENKKGFTLAETLIVLVVLGIISALVIPQLMIRYQESMNRLKIKKNWTVYDGAIAKMTVENDLKTETTLKTWAEKENDTCDNAVKYFKTTNRENCVFRTSDGIWWDITDITKSIVAVSEKDLQNAQENGTDGKNSFMFVASFDTALGTFRVNDLFFEKNRLESELANIGIEENISEIISKVNETKKIFKFLNKSKETTSNSGHYIGNDFFTNLFGEDIEYQYDDQGRVVSFTKSFRTARSRYEITNTDYNILYNEDNSFRIISSNEWKGGKGMHALPYSFLTDITIASYDRNGNKTGAVGTEIKKYEDSGRYVKTVTTYDANDNVVSETNYDENDNVITE